MAVARAVSRLVAGAEVALAVCVLAACGSPSPVGQQVSGSPAAEAGAPGTTPGTAAPAAPGQPGGGRPNPAPTRASLFGAFNAAGEGGTINLLGVPDGANCTVTAHRQGRSEQLAITEDQPQVAAGGSIQFTLVNPPAGATIVWSATCTLRGETAVKTAQTSTEPAQTPAAPPTATPPASPAAPPSHAATSTPAGANPSATP